jgi:hypothetical protein
MQVAQRRKRLGREFQEDEVLDDGPGPFSGSHLSGGRQSANYRPPPSHLRSIEFLECSCGVVSSRRASRLDSSLCACIQGACQIHSREDLLFFGKLEDDASLYCGRAEHPSPPAHAVLSLGLELRSATLFGLSPRAKRIFLSQTATLVRLAYPVASATWLDNPPPTSGAAGSCPRNSTATSFGFCSPVVPVRKDFSQSSSDGTVTSTFLEYAA